MILPRKSSVAWLLFNIYHQKEEVAMIWSHHKNYQSFYFHPTRYHLRKKKRQTGKNGQRSPNGLENQRETLAHKWDIWMELVKCSATTTQLLGLMMHEMFSLFFNDKEKAALWLGQEAVRWWENHWSTLNTL